MPKGSVTKNFRVLPNKLGSAGHPFSRDQLKKTINGGNHKKEISLMWFHWREKQRDTVTPRVCPLGTGKEYV